MPNYKIVGAADCPYFARAERIGHILACTFPALHHGIQIEMKSPSAWTSYFTQMCRELGYTPYKAGGSIKSSSYTLAQAAGGFDPADLDPSSHEGRVLVWDPITRRVIGGESAFKQEAYQKYGVRCDISWGRCLAIAQENAQLFATKQSHHAMRPLNIIIAGRPMSGKRTQIPRLVEKFNLVHINCGTVIAQAAKRDTESGRFIADYFKKRLAMLTSTPKVESESEALLVPPSKSVPELGFAKGEHLEDPLAVHKEQVALSWEEDCNILRAAEAQIPLLPDSLVIPLVLSALQAPEVKERGFLLEGFPRTPAQAQALVNADIPIDAVILLDIDQQTALERQRCVRQEW